MVITCGKCNKTYNIDASKLPAQTVMATCKKCGNRFRINAGRAPQPRPQPPAPAPVSIEAREAEMGLMPLSGLTTALRVLLIINIIVTVAAVFAGLYEYQTYKDLPPGFDINETFLPSDAVNAIVGLIHALLYIILVIIFLRWIYRTNKNLGVLSGQPLRITPGWSVGWYFIPFANLFKPYQAMKEIWEISHINQFPTKTILVLWWSCWLISGFLGELAIKFLMEAETMTGYISTTVTYIASDSFDVVLNIVALILVTRIGTAYSKNYCRPKTFSGGYSTMQMPNQPNQASSAPFTGHENAGPC